MDMLFDWVPEGKLSSDEAKELLAPHAGELCSCWQFAWLAWNEEVSADGRERLTSRSRSSCLNDFAVERAKEVFAGYDDVEGCSLLGFFKLYVGKRAVLRFKRLNRDKLAMNIRTGQQVAYYLDEHIPGIRPDRTRLTIGYILNPAETDIDDILITYQHGRKSLLWSFSLLEGVETITMPQPAVASPTPISIQPKIKTTKEGHGA